MLILFSTIRSMLIRIYAKLLIFIDDVDVFDPAKKVREIPGSQPSRFEAFT